MKEQEFQDTIKSGVKSPSFAFTDKVMDEISTVHNKVQEKNIWNIRILLLVSCFLFMISIIVKLPEMIFLDYTIEFSPIIMPIFSLIFICVELNQLIELRKNILDNQNNNVLQQCI